MSIPASKVALVMGVANSRSIAWTCVEHFCQQGWKVIVTCQSEKIRSKIQPLLLQNYQPNILGCFECDALRDLNDSSGSTSTFQERLNDVLEDRPLSAVIHSLAYAPNIKTNSLLQTTREDFSHAHEVSAYSLIQIARQTKDMLTREGTEGQSSRSSSSITALSYIGAVRAIPGYHSMGPAKASLESIVRGLALELADENVVSSPIRVNAVSAGPLPTLSARGGIAGFDQMRQDMELRAPLGNITNDHVASTIHFLSSQGAGGITGQTIYVDGGYSIIGGPGMPSRRDCDSR